MQTVIVVLVMGGLLLAIVASITEQKAPRQYREKLSWITDLSALGVVVGFGLAVIAAFV